MKLFIYCLKLFIFGSEMLLFLWYMQSVSLKGDILEDPANEPKKDMYMMSVDPEDAPDQAE